MHRPDLYLFESKGITGDSLSSHSAYERHFEPLAFLGFESNKYFLKAKLPHERCLQFLTGWCGLCLGGIWGMSLGCKHKPHLPAALGLSPTLSAFFEMSANPAESISGLTGKEPGAAPGWHLSSRSRTEELLGMAVASVNAPLHFFFSSAKNSFFLFWCYWGFYSYSHPPQLSALQTPAFHLQSDFVIHGWFQISLSAW